MPALFEFRDIALDPTHDCRMNYVLVALRHHFYQVAITELVRHISPNTESNDLGIKVTTVKQRNGRLVA